ncbi:MAG: D-tyrosyl-tRNA(Tyr) deacylase [Halobacteriovoraceae bacterium]|nr:D-tyrosyl-tRNA(Tyr) deacylase [Halobacteriovoraceae bacterium]|tara:strand:+ start:939 stop:1373 length:435 start_codon:yes stop_codon:yes gene_type:complete
MRVVIQRSGQSSVTVNNQVIGKINHGVVLLICVEKKDSLDTIKKAVKKILDLRIFEDEQGKMNKSIIDVGGSILAISQFTLSWRGTKGNRPSFDQSMPPKEASEIFNKMILMFKKDVPVETGEFGASMNVNIENLGPVTFSLDF